MKKIIILALCAVSFAVAAPKNALALLTQLARGVGYIGIAVSMMTAYTQSMKSKGSKQEKCALTLPAVR